MATYRVEGVDEESGDRVFWIVGAATPEEAKHIAGQQMVVHQVTEINVHQSTSMNAENDPNYPGTASQSQSDAAGSRHPHPSLRYGGGGIFGGMVPNNAYWKRFQWEITKGVVIALFLWALIVFVFVALMNA